MGPLTGLIIVLGGSALAAAVFGLWLHTKGGKKWLASL